MKMLLLLACLSERVLANGFAGDQEKFMGQDCLRWLKSYLSGGADLIT